MSLKGINRGEVLKMIDLLDQIKALELMVDTNSNDDEHVHMFRMEILEAYQIYEIMLQNIADQVHVYQKIYSKIKFKVLPQKLKALKKLIPPDDNLYNLLQESIHRSYAR